MYMCNVCLMHGAIHHMYMGWIFVGHDAHMTCTYVIHMLVMICKCLVPVLDMFQHALCIECILKMYQMCSLFAILLFPNIFHKVYPMLCSFGKPWTRLSSNESDVATTSWTNTSVEKNGSSWENILLGDSMLEEWTFFRVAVWMFLK